MSISLWFFKEWDYVWSGNIQKGFQEWNKVSGFFKEPWYAICKGLCIGNSYGIIVICEGCMKRKVPNGFMGDQSEATKSRWLYTSKIKVSCHPKWKLKLSFVIRLFGSKWEDENGEVEGGKR